MSFGHVDQLICTLLVFSDETIGEEEEVNLLSNHRCNCYLNNIFYVLVPPHLMDGTSSLLIIGFPGERFLGLFYCGG